MRNLHKYYYKDYFSSDEVLVGNTNRRLDYELLVDDTKKNLESRIKEKDKKIKEAKGKNDIHLKTQLEGKKKELEEQLAVNVNVLKVRNKTLTGTDFVKKDRQNNPTRELVDEAKIINEVSPNDNVNRFSLSIQYPGLVTGIGINHEAKIEGEFKLGVHFDWTYGMPVVYGSSVKGVLRSAFIEEQKNGKILKYEKYFLEKCTGEEWSQKEIEILFDSIFEGKENGKPKSIYDRDIFFDAVIVEADPQGRILASDSITPHGGENHDNPLKNPTPLTFMKIASGCKMEFRFKLVKSVVGDKEFTAAQKKTLFEEILKTIGIGAKTNVGYGQFKR